MIVDANGNEIKSPDLEHGDLIETTIAKPGAYDTIDNVTKFALTDDDFMQVQRYVARDPEKEADAKKYAEREAFLDSGQDQITQVMQAVAELGVLVAGGK